MVCTDLTTPLSVSSPELLCSTLHTQSTHSVPDSFSFLTFLRCSVSPKLWQPHPIDSRCLVVVRLFPPTPTVLTQVPSSPPPGRLQQLPEGLRLHRTAGDLSEMQNNHLETAQPDSVYGSLWHREESPGFYAGARPGTQSHRQLPTGARFSSHAGSFLA